MRNHQSQLCSGTLLSQVHHGRQLTLGQFFGKGVIAHNKQQHCTSFQHLDSGASVVVQRQEPSLQPVDEQELAFCTSTDDPLSAQVLTPPPPKVLKPDENLTEKPGQQRKPVQCKGKRRVTQHWLQDKLSSYSWLRFDSERNLLFCDPCRRHWSDQSKKTSHLVTGCDSFKNESLEKHHHSSMHEQCLRADMVSQSAACLPVMVRNMSDTLLSQLKMLFNIAYYVVQHSRPMSDFPDLIALHAKNGIKVTDQYTSDKQCREFIKHVAIVERQQQMKRLCQEPPTLTVMLDASTDVSQVEHVLFYVRYCPDKESQPVTEFLAVESLPGGDALSYLNVFKAVMEKSHLDNWRERLIGLATDGCSAMRGRKQGLTTRLQNEVSTFTTVHCVAHRLQLAILDAAKDLPYLGEKFEPTLKKLFNFYHYSPRRQRDLKEISTILDHEISKLGEIHAVRWVASKLRALQALKKSFGPVVAHLECLAERPDIVAKCLLKKLQQQEVWFLLSRPRDLFECYTS